MEREFERSDWQLTNNKYPPYSWVYNIFVDKTYSMFGVFTQAIKFDCLFLGIF